MNITTKDLIQRNEEDAELILHKDKCDKYDYLTAVGCGAIGGVIDIFLVGAPGDSVLGKWTDKQVDNAVMCFAKRLGWDPKAGQQNNVKSAIGFLESGSKKSGFGGFKVNYDQRKPSDTGGAVNLAPKTHHMMSLAHSPDIIGLFFSILNQFTSTSSFISGGQIITINTENYTLQGGNLVAKLFCGVFNWFGHLMSDVAGGSGAHGRGSGIVMPFYELFGFCKFGSFATKDGKKDLAELAMQAFNQGYDFRFGLAMAIPVLVTELSIKLIWSLRRRIQYKCSLRDCIPSGKHEDLRIMLLIGHGTLCIMDGVDAAIRSHGDCLALFVRLNLVGWSRLAVLAIKEVCIRLGIAADMDLYVESYKRINAALDDYLSKLKAIDFELYRKETEERNKLLGSINTIGNEKELSEFLLDSYEALGIDKPWEGDFDDFMADAGSRLVFK